MRLSLPVLTTSLFGFASVSSALPSGALYAKRLPRKYDNFDAEPIRRVLERANNHHDHESVMDPKPNTSTAPYPIYRALSDFDSASFNLGLYQEYIELDLFHNGLAKFSEADFEDAGINVQYRSFINFMANQEVAHAALLSHIYGPGAAQMCEYTYPYTTVREFLDFCQRVTRWGESGVLGFLSQLNSRDSATLLGQSIATEGRQQMAFRQMLGAPAMPVAFETGIPQNWAWTLLAPYIKSCPTGNPRVMWSNFPALEFAAEGPSLIHNDSKAAVWTNETALIEPKLKLSLKWEKPGKKVGPDGKYTTRQPKSKAKYAAHVTHLNVTYTELFDVKETSAVTYVPSMNPPPYPEVEGSITLLNGTNFLVITSDNPYVTPYNLTKINDYLVAGPAVVQYG